MAQQARFCHEDIFKELFCGDTNISSTNIGNLSNNDFSALTTTSRYLQRTLAASAASFAK